MPTSPACPVCASRDVNPLAEGRDFEYDSLPGPFHVWRCSDCGHGHLNPAPDPTQLAAIYPATYYTINPASPIHFDGFIYRTKLRRDVDRILMLAGEPTPRSVVDLGCGDAERLARVGERLDQGTALIGVDFKPDPSRQEELETRGVEIRQANIEDGLEVLDDGSYDLVLACQIIEHLYDPVGMVRSVGKKLAPGGRLLIETPNLGGVDFELFQRSHWGGYHFPRHFHFFTPGTLGRVATEAGLSVRAQGFLPSGFGIVSLRNRFGLSSKLRSRRWGEFLHMRNLGVVGAFTALDLLWIALGGETSNQYLVAQRDEGGA